MLGEALNIARKSRSPAEGGFHRFD